MESIRYVLPAAIVLALTACSSPKDASKANFAKVIDSHYARDCIVVRPRGGFGVDAGSFPVDVPVVEGRDAEQRNIERNAQFVALVQTGLLSMKEMMTEQSTMFGKAETVPTKRYALTETGQQAYQSDEDDAGRSRSPGFCAGHYQVDEIKRFSEPGAMGPYTISEVAYTYSPQDVPAWATETAVLDALPRLAEALKPAQSDEAALMLTNEGWIHQADFKD